MSEKLWVEYKTDNKTTISKVSIEGCGDDDFIKRIENEPQLGIPKNSRITLHGPSGTAIHSTKPISVLAPGNSAESPLHVQVLDTFKPASDPELTLFWNSLRGMEPENGLLKFHTKFEFIPRPMDSLYIRKAYEDLFEIIWENQKDKESINRLARMAITGTPGIGKSMFLFYILWRLANKEDTKTVILHRQMNHGNIYGFRNDGCWVVPSSTNIRMLLKDPETWYLTDALLIQPQAVDAVTILVSPPSEKYYSEFIEYTSTLMLHYLPVWSLEELQRVAHVYLRSPEEVERRFNMIGGIPRYVLEKDVDLEAKIDEEIGKLLPDKAIIQTSPERFVESEINHRLLHFKVEPPCYTKYTWALASEYVKGKFLNALRNQDEQKIRYLLRLLGDIPFAAAAVGFLFKSYANRQLSAGGRFLIRSLDTEEEDTLSLSHKTPKIFTDLLECTNPDFYYKPQVKNFACIDSLIVRTGYFRTTVSWEHEISIEGMKEIRKTVNMEKIYYVVPHTHFKEFKKQKFTGDTENISNDRVDIETNTGKENFQEDKSSNRNNKRRKTNEVNNNQSLQKDPFIWQFVLSILIDDEMRGWLSKVDESMPLIQPDGKKEGMDKKEEGMDKKEEEINKKEEGMDKKKEEGMAN